MRTTMRAQCGLRRPPPPSWAWPRLPGGRPAWQACASATSARAPRPAALAPAAAASDATLPSGGVYTVTTTGGALFRKS